MALLPNSAMASKMGSRDGEGRRHGNDDLLKANPLDLVVWWDFFGAAYEVRVDLWWMRCEMELRLTIGPSNPTKSGFRREWGAGRAHLVTMMSALPAKGRGRL